MRLVSNHVEWRLIEREKTDERIEKRGDFRSERHSEMENGKMGKPRIFCRRKGKVTYGFMRLTVMQQASKRPRSLERNGARANDGKRGRNLSARGRREAG